MYHVNSTNTRPTQLVLFTCTLLQVHPLPLIVLRMFLLFPSSPEVRLCCALFWLLLPSIARKKQNTIIPVNSKSNDPLSFVFSMFFLLLLSECSKFQGVPCFKVAITCTICGPIHCNKSKTFILYVGKTNFYCIRKALPFQLSSSKTLISSAQVKSVMFEIATFRAPLLSGVTSFRICTLKFYSCYQGGINF